MSSPLKKLAGQTAVYGLSSILGRLLNYLLVPLYTRLFAPEIYGIVTELYAYVTFLLILLTYGMETGFFRFAQDKNIFDKVYSSILVSLSLTSTLFIALLIIFLKPIAIALDYQANSEYILWIGLIVALDAFISIPFAKLRLQNKAWKFAVLKLFNIGITIGLNLYFLVLCPKLAVTNPDSFLLSVYSPAIGVGYVFMSNLIANIITLLMLLPEIFNVKFCFEKSLLKKIIIYSLPLLIAGLAGMINETLDRVLLKHLVPDNLNPMEQLGIYGANYKLAILMTLFIQMFRYAAEPFFFNNKNESNARELYAKATKYFIICGLLIFLGVMFYIDFIKYFIDVDYHEGLKVVPILLLANLFLGIFFNFSIWYKLNDMTKYGAYLAIFGAIITIVLNLILIPIYGYVGSAWATLICYVSMTLLSFYWGQKYYKVPYNILNAVFYILFALSLYFLSIYIRPDSQNLVYVVNSGLFVVFIAVFSIKEKVWLLLK
ncbi:MAG TPA: oligosaccharide flippase family protein [Bacteroidales bacterium]|nr:oligosaccharide flippase family protein [Bacteroidales bacterium]